MGSVYILGSINMDMTITSDRFPVLGETIAGKRFSTANGGKGANQAVAAARLGADVKMCGCVGKDSFGKELKSALASEGIDVSFVNEVDESTGVAVITLVDGDNTIVVAGGANGFVTPSQAKSFLMNAGRDDIMLVQLETDFETVEYSLSLAREKGMLCVINPAPANAMASKLCRYADIIIPNETELKTITGTGDVEKGLMMLKELGASVPAVTLGSEGCAFLLDGKVFFKSCPKVKAVDTTGAGDTFCGALCSYITNGHGIEESFDFALKAASLSVTKAGAQPSIPYKNQI